MDFWSVALPLMKERGIKQKDIAKETGHSSGRVCDWIDRKIMPKADDALIIADLLGVSVRYLVTGKDDSDLSAKEKELLAACKGFSDSMFNKMIHEANGIKEMMLQEKGEVSPESDMGVM